MANFAIGLGAFVDGFDKGWGIGDKIQNAYYTGKRRGALREAGEGYDKAISDNVLEQAGQADPNQPFDVDTANQKARDVVGEYTDFVYKRAVPKIIETYMQQGDLEKAEAFTKWSQDRKEQDLTKQAGRAINAWMAGQSSNDYTRFGEEAMKALKMGDYGVKPVGFEIVRNGDNMGIEFEVEDNGKKFKQRFDTMQAAAEFLTGALNPVSRVQWLQSQIESASKFNQDIAKKEIEARIGLGKDVALEDVRQGNRLQLAAANSKVNSGAQAKANMLLGAGYSQEQVNRWMPQILGIRDDERQRMSSDDVLKFAYDTLGKDFDYQDAPPDVKQKMVDDFVKAFRMKSDSIAEARNPKPSPGITGSQEPPVPVW